MGFLNFITSFNNSILSSTNSIFMAFVTIVFGITTFKEFLLLRGSFSIMLNIVILLPNAINGYVIGKDSMSRVNDYLKENFVY